MNMPWSASPVARASGRWASLPNVFVGAALLVAVIGMYWDISLHIDNGRDPGPLAHVETGRGDPHAQGRSVAVLTFEDEDEGARPADERDRTPSGTAESLAALPALDPALQALQRVEPVPLERPVSEGNGVGQFAPLRQGDVRLPPGERDGRAALTLAGLGEDLLGLLHRVAVQVRVSTGVGVVGTDRGGRVAVDVRLRRAGVDSPRGAGAGGSRHGRRHQHRPGL